MKNSEIKNITAREILDSRGSPTIEVRLETISGVFYSSVPSGTSVGKHEAVEFRDGGKRYSGKGVLGAAENVNQIIGPKLKGMDSRLQKKIDNLMIKLDGTDDKSSLGANAICGVSMAVCRAGANSNRLELFKHINDIFNQKYRVKTEVKLPNPLFNIINGGAHSSSRLDVQEFMVAVDKDSFSQKLETISEIYFELRSLLLGKHGKLAVNIGNEGGFVPPLSVSEQALEFIFKAAKNLGIKDKIKIVLDVAASQFFDNGSYAMNSGVFTSQGLLRYYSDLLRKYPILGLEDPFAEDDWQGFGQINSRFGKKVLIIGDDLLVTNTKRMKIAKEKKAVNAMILKINQIGTVSEILEAAKLAKQYSWKTIVSHRSGETNDDFISDFAVGIGADFIKAGAPARGERIAKYNRLLKIEKLLEK